MHYTEIRPLIDFGLFILIWLVQLIVYPSFRLMSSTQLVAWHTKYTPRITAVVAPLMLAQLAISILFVSNEMEPASILYFALVVSMWLLTFSFFIPLHNKIQKGEASEKLLKNLITVNWARTVVWTLISCQSLLS